MQLLLAFCYYRVSSGDSWYLLSNKRKPVQQGAQKTAQCPANDGRALAAGAQRCANVRLPVSPHAGVTHTLCGVLGVEGLGSLIASFGRAFAAPAVMLLRVSKEALDLAMELLMDTQEATLDANHRPLIPHS
jgi:hypothetical protein